ncbi:hypothetical protein N7474_003828 [Penicillium riverlandense]|uniref:uncharacterized protein n=1 Tax=Penicillium riverlandense TaxID=1903569 RepID=UPI00254915B2|nr:uncharacterized protein N7474_003828 [Penicillium riverlandense]KAJ5818237.1 hypothetical protein N7474_003828 [Penicillium riverlandense]
MSQMFKNDTQGSDVADMFPERVKHKTCCTLTSLTSSDLNLTLSFRCVVLLSSLLPGELAACTADGLSHGGAGCIIFTGHSQSDCQPVIDHLNRKHPQTKIVFITADTGSLVSMHDAALTIKKLGVPIDGLIGFPTVMAVPYETTEDGIESHIQKNYLVYFLLVNLLLDAMSPGSRVVLVTTSVRREAPAPEWEDVGFSGGKHGETYHPLDGYAQSMFANILFVKSLASKCVGRSIVAFSANPGNTKTNIQTYVSPEEVSSWLQKKKDAGEDLPILLQQVPKSQAQGSATILRGLLDPILGDQSGAFLDNNQVLTLPQIDFPVGEASATALWTRSEELVGELLRTA